MKNDAARNYWKANRRLIAALLTVWAIVSYGLSILFAEPLNTFSVGQLPMGFWWAHQGSMVVFVLLIFIYAWAMDRIDRRYGVQDEEEGDKAVQGGSPEGIRPEVSRPGASQP